MKYANNKLKELRNSKGMTQEEVAKLVGVSLRSYNSYENNKDSDKLPRYNFIYNTLSNYEPISEERGILKLNSIKQICSQVFEKYDVKYCYLFGSYAKGNAKESSDIDLLISANVEGIAFYELVEELRETLHKKIDLLEVKQLKDNIELIDEILSDGIKIYGQYKK